MFFLKHFNIKSNFNDHAFRVKNAFFNNFKGSYSANKKVFEIKFILGENGAK